MRALRRHVRLVLPDSALLFVLESESRTAA
jgi:hypothetical protein